MQIRFKEIETVGEALLWLSDVLGLLSFPVAFAVLVHFMGS